MNKNYLLFGFILILLAGCTTTQKGATLGGVTGAALGGIIGHQSDHGVQGAAIGGAVGAVGGMIVADRIDQKFCPSCGRVYPNDSKFCSVDGSELKQKQ